MAKSTMEAITTICVDDWVGDVGMVGIGCLINWVRGCVGG
jgi:hypothetical protein